MSCLLPFENQEEMKNYLIRIGILHLHKRRELYLEESEDVLKYQRWEPYINKWPNKYKDIDDYLDSESYEEKITDIISEYIDTYIEILDLIMKNEIVEDSEDLCLFSLYGGIDLLSELLPKWSEINGENLTKIIFRGNNLLSEESLTKSIPFFHNLIDLDMSGLEKYIIIILVVMIMF